MNKSILVIILIIGIAFSIFVIFSLYQQHQSQTKLAADTIILADDFGQNKSRFLCHTSEENDVVSLISTPNGTTIQCPWNCEVIKDKCVYPLSDEQIVEELRKGPQGLTSGEQRYVIKQVTSDPRVQRAIEGKQYTTSYVYGTEFSQPPKYTIGIRFATDNDQDAVNVVFDLQTLKVSNIVIGESAFGSSSGVPVESVLVVPRGDLFLQQPLRIEGLNQTQYVGQRIEFAVKFNGTKFGCQSYPSLRIEDSRHQKVWENNYILELCDPDTTPTHLEKEWEIGNSTLGTPIINMTGFYTLFAEFENNIVQHDFWVIEKTPQVRIVKGSASPEQMKNYFPQNIVVVIGINNTVTWVNEDDTPSSVTSDKEGLFSSEPIKPGHNWTYTFEKNGLYAYHSEPHPWMKGAVIVIPQNVEFLSKQEKQDIAWYILQSYFPNPVTMLGVDDDGVLVVGIQQDEIKKNPNAESYYIKKFQDKIPFNVPIRIQFGHPELQ